MTRQETCCIIIFVGDSIIYLTKGRGKHTSIFFLGGGFIIIGIGDYDSAMRNKRKVVTREGQRMYHGKKYAIEKSTGYYVCTSGKRRRLHDVMWECENIDGIKAIPAGYVVHHIDWNKNNNIINNLTCISVEGHNLIHNPPKDKYKNNKIKIEIIPGGMSKIIKIS